MSKVCTDMDTITPGDVGTTMLPQSGQGRGAPAGRVPHDPNPARGVEPHWPCPARSAHLW